MNNYYKMIENGYVLSIGDNGKIGEPITEEEYNNILSIIQNKLEDTETHYYMLRTDTLEYEAIERPEPIPIPEPTYTLDEAAAVIASEVASNE